MLQLHQAKNYSRNIYLEQHIRQFFGSLSLIGPDTYQAEITHRFQAATRQVCRQDKTISMSHWHRNFCRVQQTYYTQPAAVLQHCNTSICWLTSWSHEWVWALHPFGLQQSNWTSTKNIHVICGWYFLLQLEMWANAQLDGHPAEYRWRRLFNAAVWLTPTTRVPRNNTAKTRNPLKFAGMPQTNETISAVSGPKFTILWGHVEQILLLNKFFSDCRYMP